MLTSDHGYRIAYEAFSQFSRKIHQARTLEEVLQTLQSRLKYIFDFRVLRLCFNHDETWIAAKVSSEGSYISKAEKASLFPYEQELRSKGIPRVWKGAECQNLVELLQVQSDATEAWAWNFEAAPNRHLTITLLQAPGHNFNSKSITFLMLCAESLHSQLLEICLFDEVEQKNQDLQKALGTISEKNAEINSILEHQQEVIQSQTGELRAKNQRLLEISTLNAHKVREPLSRIIGLMNVIELTGQTDVADMLPLLQSSSSDLDEALKEVIKMADQDIKNLKAQL